MSTQPSEGAARAADEVADIAGARTGIFFGAAARHLFASAIEDKTGVGELVEALRDLLGHAEEIQRETRYGHDRYFDRARQALSRHTSAQGKEGKL